MEKPNKTHGVFLLMRKPQNLSRVIFWAGFLHPDETFSYKWEGNPRFACKMFLYQAERQRDDINEYLAEEAMVMIGKRLSFEAKCRVVPYQEAIDIYDVHLMTQKLAGAPF